MEENMINGLFSSRTRTSLRNILSPRYGEHNFQQLKIYYQEHTLEVNDAFLQNLDFYTSEGKLNMVAYLLADTNSLSVRFAKYAGTDKCDLLETQEFGYCSLLKAMDKLWDKIDVENRTMARVTNQLRREEKRLVDYTALREAFVNAFVHNDYTTEQAPVVEMFSDRLTITSYGGLVSDLTQEEFFNGRSIPRNRELMRIFHDMEWVEQLGSGIHRILRRYPKDIYEISEHFVVVTFKFAESLTDTSNVSQNVSQRISTERQSLIRQRIIENNTISARSIAEELGVNIRTIYRELKQLNIHWIGSPKSGHWEFI
jgi:predicted HTH transcriptional regulator